MVIELKAVHGELLQCIAALELVVRRPTPDTESLTAARWKLTRASGRRRRLLTDRVFPALAAVPVTNTPRLQELRAETAAMLTVSSQHIARWTVDKIVANWGEYQRASTILTASMRNRIATEKIILHPLLAILA